MIMKAQINCYYEYHTTVNSHTCDYNDLLKPSGYLHYMQEAANLQVLAADFGYDSCAERGTAFVLSRLALDVFTPLHAYDGITCRTMPAKSSGVSFMRSTLLLKDGKPAAALSSL